MINQVNGQLTETTGLSTNLMDNQLKPLDDQPS